MQIGQYWKSIAVGVSLLMAASVQAAPLKIQHWKTTEGLGVYFVPTTELPMVDIRVLFSAGSSQDGTAFGLASLTNHLLGEGTAHQTADQIALNFDRVGAGFSSAVNRDSASVSLRTLTAPAYFSPALKQFILALDHPVFREKAMNRNRQLMRTSIKAASQNPGDIAAKVFFSTLYKGQPYAHSVEGTLKSLDQLRLDQVKAFYKQFYVASNATITMVGNLTHEQAKKVAQKISLGLSVGVPAKKMAVVPSLKKSTRIHVHYPATQTSIIIGQVGIAPNNPQYFPLKIANSVFGSLPFNSILFHDVRTKRGLTYSVSSQLVRYQNKGPFLIRLKTRASKADESIKVIKSLLESYLKDGPTAAQLRLAKDNLVGGFPLLIATNSAILSNVSHIAFYGLPLNYLSSYTQHLAAVTEKQAQTAYAQLLHPNKLLVVTVGP